MTEPEIKNANQENVLTKVKKDTPEVKLVKIGENPDGTEILKKFNVIDLKGQEYDEQFQHANLFEKFAVITAREAGEGEVVVTKIVTKEGEMEETKNVAGKGDMIAKNPGGEEYIIRAQKFPKLYELLPDGTYKAKGVVKAIQTDKDVVFMSPWGEEMKILSGGYLVESVLDGNRYGIEEEAFKNTYKKKES